MRRAAAAAPPHAAAGTSSERAKPSTTVTDMYLYLQELEREAERAEVECATHANSTSAQNECTTKFLDASDEIELARLAARAVGVAEEPEGKVARAGVKKARTNKAAALQAAAEEEMNCIESGGGAECTVAFNDAWDQAEELEKDAVLRCRRILRGWVATHKQHA